MSVRLRAKAWAVVILIAASSAGAARAAGPGPDPAEKLFDAGLADMEAGRFDKACPAIEESYKLDPRPGTLFTLADCEAKRGRLATAVKRYDDYLALYAALAPDKKKKQGDREKAAREEKATLLPLVPELTLTMPPTAPPGTLVTRDGAPVAAAALGVGMPVDPGEHVVTVQAPGGPASETRITIGRGEKRGILLEVKEIAAPAPAPKAAPPPEPPPDRGPSGRRVGAWVAGGVGLAGIVAGAVTGGLALAKKGTVGKNCGAGIGQADPTACTHDGKLAADAMKTFGLVSTIGFIAGGAGAATSVVLFATEPKAAVPSGAGIGLRGVW